MASASAYWRESMLKHWQTDGFILYCMGIALMFLALYILTGEAVVRRNEFEGLTMSVTTLDQRLTRLEAPPPAVPKKSWWQRR